MRPFTTSAAISAGADFASVMPIALYAASTRSCGEAGAAQTVPTPIPRPIVAAESIAAAAIGRCL